MQFLLFAAVLLGLSAVGFQMGRRRAMASVGGRIRDLHSVPAYYGGYVAIWAGLPALAFAVLWFLLRGTLTAALVTAGSDYLSALPPGRLDLVLANVRTLAAGGLAPNADLPEIQAAAAHWRELQTIGDAIVAALVLAAAVGGLTLARRRVRADFRARNRVERLVDWLLIACASFAVLITAGIVLSLLFESLRFFARVPLWDFLFGTQWSPQTALRADQVGASGSFGAVPLFAGTALISLIAMCVAVPLGLMSAIYLSEYASRGARALLKPILEILAGVPTVVYGFFAALTVAPFIRGWGASIGLDVSSESALAAGLVMGVMIIPFVSSLSDDVINAVPQSLRDGSYAMGATKSETIRQVVVPAALPGIVGAVLLAASRAIGETMIVVMAAGLAANLTANPLESVTTVTVQIASLLVGDQEFDSAKTLSAFALGLVLFLATLALNVVALRVVQKYREKYD